MNLKSSQSSYSSEETLSDAITRIMDEEQDWLRIMNLEGDKLLSVYLDIKSPHAYIAVRPTLEVARDYRVKIDFRPYTLSYTSLGLTTSLEDNKRQPPTPEGDRKARMYYATGRQYAALQKIPFRTPYRLLDSELANRVFLFAKQHIQNNHYRQFYYVSVVSMVVDVDVSLILPVSLTIKFKLSSPFK